MDLLLVELRQDASTQTEKNNNFLLSFVVSSLHLIVAKEREQEGKSLMGNNSNKWLPRGKFKISLLSHILKTLTNSYE